MQDAWALLDKKQTVKQVDINSRDGQGGRNSRGGKRFKPEIIGLQYLRLLLRSMQGSIIDYQLTATREEKTKVERKSLVGVGGYEFDTGFVERNLFQLVRLDSIADEKRLALQAKVNMKCA